MSDNNRAAVSTFSGQKLLTEGRADVGRISASSAGGASCCDSRWIIGIVLAYLLYRALHAMPMIPFTGFGPNAATWMPGIILVLLLAAVMIVPMLSTRPLAARDDPPRAHRGRAVGKHGLDAAGGRGDRGR